MEDVAGLLFELASTERLGVLLLTQTEALRLSQIAKRLNMTTSETSRNLDRLKDQRLIEKGSNGRYELTSYGKVVISLLPLLKSLTDHREYILTHDLTILPQEFIMRLGELIPCLVFKGVYKVVKVQEETMRKVKNRFWIMSKEAFHTAIPIIKEKLRENVDIRMIIPEAKLSSPDFEFLNDEGSINCRILHEVNMVLAVLDREGGICLPSLNGDIDISTMLGVNPKSSKWLEDLYLHYWEKAESFTATTNR